MLVVWNGENSNVVNVDYGVRQGSIIGPLLFLVHVADMEYFLDIDGESYVVYADNSNLWQSASTWDDVRAALEDKAAKFAVWAKWNGLAMNAAKTQLLVSANAGPAGGLSVCVGENNIVCSNTLELLGVRYERKMSAVPHVDDMAKSAKQRAGLVARLSHHLPRGRLLCHLASGLVFGKLNHALGAVATPRLHPNTPTNGRMASVQVAVNDVARSVIGGKRSDRVAVLELNARAQFPLVNELVTKTVAMVTWVAFHSRDGNPKGGRNPLGAAMFDGTGYSRTTRASAAGKAINPMPGQNTLVSTGIKIWNACPELRVAATK
jgi:hypothetical protein